MPLFSCFTPLGHYVLSSDTSHGEKIYNQIVTGWNGNYSSAVGSRSEAWAYATAMLLARVRYAKDRAANQMDPHTVEEMLPVREAMYGLSPSRNATETDRRAALEEKYKLPKGASYAEVNQALIDLLGSDFLYYRTTKVAEIVTWPVSPEFGGGLFNDPRLPAKVIQLTSAVSIVGSPVLVTYEPIDSQAQSTIQVGDTVCVSPNNIGLIEKVIVTVAGLSLGKPSFIAQFEKSHDVGDIGTTGYFPYWISTQGHVIVVVTPACAADPEKKRKIHLKMEEIMCGWVTWDICPSTDGLVTDAFTIGDPVLGRIGYAGIGSVAFP